MNYSQRYATSNCSLLAHVVLKIKLIEKSSSIMKAIGLNDLIGLNWLILIHLLKSWDLTINTSASPHDKKGRQICGTRRDLELSQRQLTIIMRKHSNKIASQVLLLTTSCVCVLFVKKIYLQSVVTFPTPENQLKNWFINGIQYCSSCSSVVSSLVDFKK